MELLFRDLKVAEGQFSKDVLESKMKDEENPLNKRPLSIMYLIGGSQKDEDEEDTKFIDSLEENLKLEDFINHV